MAPSTASFKIRFPEFEPIPDIRVEMFIDDAVLELSESSWGDRYDVGVYYLAAHLLAMGSETAAGNPSGIVPISGGSADGLSTTFSRSPSTSMTQEYWQSTSYGREYMRLKRTLFAGARVV